MTLGEEAPAGLAQWTERRPVDGRVSGWIGVKGTYLPCRLDPCPLGGGGARLREATYPGVSLTSMILSASPVFFFSGLPKNQWREILAEGYEKSINQSIHAGGTAEHSRGNLKSGSPWSS